MARLLSIWSEPCAGGCSASVSPAAVSLAAGIVLGEFALQRDASRRRPRCAPRRGGRGRGTPGSRSVRIAAADGIILAGWLFTRGKRPRCGARGAQVGGSRDHATHARVPARRRLRRARAGCARTRGERQVRDLWRCASRRHPALGGMDPAARPRVRLRPRVVDGRRARADGEPSQPTFCAIVSDSAFATFLDAGLDRIRRAARPR